MFVRLAIVWLGLASIVIAQQPQQNIQFVQPAKTIEEAVERQNTAERTAADKLAEAEAKYQEEVDKANEQLVEDLKQLAKKAAANGDIADAAKAWEAVLDCEADNEDALDFFRAIGRLDVVSKSRKRTSGKREGLVNPLQAYVGRWTGVWSTTGKPIDLTIEQNGRIGNAKLNVTEDSAIWIQAGRSQYVELIPARGRMLVLGWSVRKQLSPTAPARSPQAIPDHVGIAWKE